LCSLPQLEGPHLDKAHAVQLPVLLNSAACYGRAEDWNAVVRTCSEVRVFLAV
jgi:hypothetical protein